MKFTLIDHVVEQSPDRVIARKHVSLAEEYLADHFPTFPVLPGVLMVEAMVQAARLMLATRSNDRLVPGEVKAFKFAGMVRPGEALEVEVSLAGTSDDGSFLCKGTGAVLRFPSGAGNEPARGETACSGRFTMRPVRCS
jgi:3-hydroxyacyl-[acyl-carrier-protein] dehydratase